MGVYEIVSITPYQFHIGVGAIVEGHVNGTRSRFEWDASNPLSLTERVIEFFKSNYATSVRFRGRQYSLSGGRGSTELMDLLTTKHLDGSFMPNAGDYAPQAFANAAVR